MVGKNYLKTLWALPMAIIGMCLLLALVVARPAAAITPLPTPDPIPGAYGLEATKRKPPPTTGATISTPGNGASFTTSPIAVNGICPDGLLVEVFNNGVMVGAVMCQNGSFSVQVSLFAGTNELTAIVYDEIDQPGPTSNTVTVTYTDTNFTAFGQLITLTSSYGRRAAAAGAPLSWPLQLSGGTGPYAFSIDWGDGGKAELKSQSLAGLLNISHVYKKAGIYQVSIRVTDVNGVSAFLQVIAVANGKVDSSTAAATDGKKVQVKPAPEILWWPTIIVLLMIAPSYWLGKHSQLVIIRNRMLKERDQYQQE